MAIITPFNFPLEIPLLQLMGALFMGNKPILKVDSKVFNHAVHCMQVYISEITICMIVLTRLVC